MKAVTVGAGIAAASLQAAVAKGAPDWTAARDTALAEGTAATRDVMETVTPVQIAVTGGTPDRPRLRALPPRGVRAKGDCGGVSGAGCGGTVRQCVVWATASAPMSVRR